MSSRNLNRVLAGNVCALFRSSSVHFIYHSSCAPQIFGFVGKDFFGALGLIFSPTKKN